MLLTTAMTTGLKNLPPDLPLIQQKHRQMTVNKLLLFQ